MNELQNEQYRLLVEFDRICRKHSITYQLNAGTLLGAIRHQGFIPWDDDIDVVLVRSEYDRFVECVNSELSSDMFFQNRDTDKDYFHSFAKLRSNKYELKEQSSAHLRSHHGVWLDVFPMDGIPADSEKKLLQKKKIMFYNKLISLMHYTFVTEEDRGPKRIIKSFMSNINRLTYRINFIVPFLYKKRDRWMRLYPESDMTNLLSYNYDDRVYETTYISRASLLDPTQHLFEAQEFLIPKDYDAILTLLYGDYMKLPKEQDRISNHYIV